MDRRTLLLAAAALPLAACTPAPYGSPLSAEQRRALRLSSISVTAQGAGFESGRAADRASDIGPDLRAALQGEFRNRLGGSGGAAMQVEVSRLNVAGGASTAFGRDLSRLSGQVRLVRPDGTLLASYTVQVVEGAAAETRAGALIGAATTTAGGNYRGLVTNFARETREQILGGDLPGERLLRNTLN